MTQTAAHLTYGEYLAIEERSGQKHEFCHGAAVAMAGGTIVHGHIAGNAYRLLATALEGRPCRPFNSDVKLRVAATALATYPDVAVVCGPIVRDVEDRNAITNATLVVEVLSPSTEAYDRGEKFAHYRRIETLQEYVLISSQSTRIEVFRRNANSTWTFAVFGPSESVVLESIQTALSVDAVYMGADDLRG